MGKYDKKNKRGQYGQNYVSSGGYEPSSKSSGVPWGTLGGTVGGLATTYGLYRLGKSVLWDPRYNPDKISHPEHFIGGRKDISNYTGDPLQVGKHVEESRPNPLQRYFMSKMPLPDMSKDWQARTDAPPTPEALAEYAKYNAEHPVPTFSGDMANIKNKVGTWYSSNIAPYVPDFVNNSLSWLYRAAAPIAENTVSNLGALAENAGTVLNKGLQQVQGEFDPSQPGANLNTIDSAKQKISNIFSGTQEQLKENPSVVDTILGKSEAVNKLITPKTPPTPTTPPGTTVQQPQQPGATPQNPPLVQGASVQTPKPPVKVNTQTQGANLQAGADPNLQQPGQVSVPAPAPQSGVVVPPVTPTNPGGAYGAVVPRYAGGAKNSPRIGGPKYGTAPGSKTWSHIMDDLFYPAGNSHTGRFEPKWERNPVLDQNQKPIQLIDDQGQPMVDDQGNEVYQTEDVANWGDMGIKPFLNTFALNPRMMLGAGLIGAGLYNRYNPKNLGGHALNRAVHWTGSKFANNNPYNWSDRWHQPLDKWATYPTLALLGGLGLWSAGGNVLHNVRDLARLGYRTGEMSINSIKNAISGKEKKAKVSAEGEPELLPGQAGAGAGPVGPQYYTRSHLPIDQAMDSGATQQPRGYLPPQFSRYDSDGNPIRPPVTPPENPYQDAFSQTGQMVPGNYADGARVPRYGLGGEIAKNAIMGTLGLGGGGALAGTLIPYGVRSLKRGNPNRAAVGIGVGGLGGLAGATMAGVTGKNLYDLYKGYRSGIYPGGPTHFKLGETVMDADSLKKFAEQFKQLTAVENPEAQGYFPKEQLYKEAAGWFGTDDKAKLDEYFDAIKNNRFSPYAYTPPSSPEASPDPSTPPTPQGTPQDTTIIPSAWGGLVRRYVNGGQMVPRFADGGRLVPSAESGWDRFFNMINAVGKRKNMATAAGTGTEGGYAPYDFLRGLYDMGVHRVVGGALAGAGNVMQSLGADANSYQVNPYGYSAYSQPQPQQQPNPNVGVQSGQNTPVAGQQAGEPPARYLPSGNKENYGGTIGRSLGGIVGSLTSTVTNPLGLIGGFLGLSKGPNQSELTNNLKELGGTIGNWVGEGGIGDTIGGLGTWAKEGGLGQTLDSIADFGKGFRDWWNKPDTDPEIKPQGQQNPQAGNANAAAPVTQPTNLTQAAEGLDDQLDKYEGKVVPEQQQTEANNNVLNNSDQSNNAAYGKRIPRYYRGGWMMPRYDNGGYHRLSRSPYQRTLYMAPIGAGIGALSGSYYAKQKYEEEMRKLLAMKEQQDVSQQIADLEKRGPEYGMNALIGGLGGGAMGTAIGGFGDTMTL